MKKQQTKRAREQLKKRHVLTFLTIPTPSKIGFPQDKQKDERNLQGYFCLLVCIIPPVPGPSQ
jgi:hypothetical protein